MRIRIPLSANVPARQNFQAQSIVLASLGAASSVRLMVLGSDQQDAEDYGQCERLFGIYDPARVFTGVELTATVDCTVELIVSRSRVEVMDGATVLATIDAAQLPLSVQTVGAPWTDRSGTIAAVGVSQQAMAANAARRGLWIQNLSAVDALWLREGAAASQGQPSLKIAPGAIYETPAGGCPVSAINLTGPTAGQAFSAREW